MYALRGYPMNTANQTRREVMALAWDKFRFEAGRAYPWTFGAALAHAWRWIKGAAERDAARLAWAASDKRITYLRSPIASPTSRRLAGCAYAGVLDRQAGYTIARLGY